jgi:hypothetical protein
MLGTAAQVVASRPVLSSTELVSLLVIISEASVKKIAKLSKL